MSEWILDPDGRPVQSATIEEWAKWFETADRTVRKTEIGSQ